MGVYDILYVDCLMFVRDRGPNAPLGIWAAGWAGTSLGGIAFEVATRVRKELDAGKHRR